jgi:hypothetical protein
MPKQTSSSQKKNASASLSQKMPKKVASKAVGKISAPEITHTQEIDRR